VAGKQNGPDGPGQDSRQTGHTNKWTNKPSQQGAMPNGLRLTLRMSDMPWGRKARGLGLVFGIRIGIGIGIGSGAFNLCHCWPNGIQANQVQFI